VSLKTSSQSLNDEGEPHSGFVRNLGRAIIVAATLSSIAYAADKPATPPPAAPPVPLVPPIAVSPSVVPDDADAAAAADEELAAQPVSNAARTRLERVRDSVVQIRGFVGDGQSDAFHGSGFAATADGLIVTNYHVVSEAILYPQQYRLEYLASDGRSGQLVIHGFDVEHDLAVVKAENFAPRALRIRTQIPSKGDRAYSVGFPLNLGLTITEGVSNGLVEKTLEQKIHYSGAMNGGMSGGPALDAGGAVYGVNVSVLYSGQSVSFVVPAKHIEPLLARSKAPLDSSSAREQVAAQLLQHQASLFDSIPAKLETQTFIGYALPAKIAPAFECNSGGSMDPNMPVRISTIGCWANVGVYVQKGLDTGDIYFLHRILQTDRLHPLQFSDFVNKNASAFAWGGSQDHVAPFACKNDIVALNGFDARVSICMRQYRMYASLYDVAVTVVSLKNSQDAVLSNVRLRGVAFDAATKFIRRYLEGMQWKQ